MQKGLFKKGFTFYRKTDIYDVYSKARLQIIRWNKSREASTENEEKQKGLNVGKRTTKNKRDST